MKHSLVSLLLCLNLIVRIAHGQGEPLVEPEIIDSVGGVLDVRLSIQYGDWNQTALTLTNTRLFNKALPGPTLRVSPGDTMNIEFRNELKRQDSAVITGNNRFKYPDTSNLHFHGAHVSGELPSDDVRFNVYPGEVYEYTTHFPSNHMGGTHWIHPHVHGSTTLHIAGGAASALIVRDTNQENDLPMAVQEATEVLLVIQEMDPDALNRFSSNSGDDRLSADYEGGLGNRWYIVNGQYQPVYSMTANTWYRFRMIHAGYKEDATGLEIEGCEMHLLAKDGVYIRDFPRSISRLPIPAGGRADAMIRCEDARTYTMTDYQSKTVMTLDVSGDGLATRLPDWTPEYPEYLSDLTDTEADDGCACRTVIDECGDTVCVNGRLWNENVYIHSIPFGSVVERRLVGIEEHPYHQHVYPYQIVERIGGMNDRDAEYWQVGDWHDVIEVQSAGDDAAATVRYRANVHTGVIMLHCHISAHEDRGAMSQELVVDDSNAICGCTSVASSALANSDALACMSSEATAIVENKGKVHVKDIQVGDKVLTASNDYKTVYTIDHKYPEKKTRFLQIYSNETSAPLEITESHMVFISDAKTPVPASKVREGDKIQMLNGATSTVNKISHVTRDGIWNPITTDGTIVVDGVIASTYSLAFGSETLQILGFDIMSHHDFLHLLMTPYRAMCLGLSLSFCESSSSHELNAYSRLGTFLLESTAEQNVVIQNLTILGILVTFGSIYLLTKPLVICLGFVAFYSYIAKGRKQQRSRRG